MTKVIAIIVGLFILFVGVVLTLNYFQVLPSFFSKKATITIKDQTFTATVAETDKQKQVGLSNKSELTDNEALLFTFDEPNYYAFWMKDMKFPIDMFFIRDNKVVTIHKNVQPQAAETADEQLIIYKPTEPATMVLETKAGVADTHAIQVGDTVTIDL